MAGRVEARDIADSLGKLPPQAPDLEEAVLGAIMLEKSALPAVQQFLKPHHFYVEKHKLIYEAILGLAGEKISIDMLSVTTRLRTLGKLEQVDGAFYVAEITSKVSSAANIEHHARVIMEYALKRSLIEIASKIHTDAYEDTTDVFELLDRTDLYLKVAKDGTLVQSIEEKLKELWADRHLTVQPIEPPSMLKYDDCSIAQAGNNTLIIGKKKSRKSLLIVALVGKYLQENPTEANSVMIFDTEQSRTHAFRQRERISRMSGGKLINVFFLRGMRSAERLNFIENTLHFWPSKPKLVIIDGIRDLIDDILDSHAAADLIHRLETMQLEHQVAFINVLHMNKGDDNARGHIGSELTNKALATIAVELDEKTGLSKVSCESSRDPAFSAFDLTHGPDGLPIITGRPEGNSDAAKNARIALFQKVFDGNQLRRKELIDNIIFHFGCAARTATKHIKTAISDGWIIQSGKEHSAASTYSLIVAPTLIPMTAIHPTPAEPNTPVPIHQKKPVEFDDSDLQF